MYTNVYFVLDDMGGKRVGIHKFYVPNSEDMVDGAEFMVLGKDGLYRHIGEESRILSKILKSFMVIPYLCRRNRRPCKRKQKLKVT